MLPAALFRAPPVSGLFVAIILVSTALLLITAGKARAETADERELRDHAAGNNLQSVQTLLAQGVNPNVPDHNGRTAVHHAADKANALVLKALLEAGGNPDAQDTSGSTPLHLAADFPYVELDSQLSVRVLLSYMADPDLADREGRTPLHLVARNHHQATSVRDLLSSGAEPDKADRLGDTAFHYAVGRDSKLSADVVEALVDGGADGKVRGAGGETPLQLFVRVGSNDGRIVDALIDGGADVDAKNPDGESPMHTAIRNGGSSENNRVVEALLAAGADPCIKDTSGFIPYNTAREGGEVHTMLANAGGYDRACDGREAAAELSAGPPGQLCSVGGDDDCWLEVADRDGCYLRKVFARPEETATWSGDCPDGRASGVGTEVITFRWASDRPWITISFEGTYRDEQREGHWIERWDGGGAEGPYVNGKRHGPWVFVSEEGRVSEGPYVHGKRHGHWIVRRGEESVAEGSYVNGRREGHWIERWDEVAVDEGSYANGVKHGLWASRDADGNCKTIEYSHGDFVELTFVAC